MWPYSHTRNHQPAWMTCRLSARSDLLPTTTVTAGDASFCRSSIHDFTDLKLSCKWQQHHKHTVTNSIKWSKNSDRKVLNDNNNTSQGNTGQQTLACVLICCMCQAHSRHRMRPLWTGFARTAYCVDTTSSTKPLVYKTLNCRQWTTEQRPLLTHTEDLVKFRHVVFRYASGQTDRLTDTLIAILCTSTGGKQLQQKMTTTTTTIVSHSAKLLCWHAM